MILVISLESSLRRRPRTAGFYPVRAMNFDQTTAMQVDGRLDVPYLKFVIDFCTEVTVRGLGLSDTW